MSSIKKKNKIEKSVNTLALHAGLKLDKDFRSRALPIYQTTSYVFEDCDVAKAIFNLENPGHIYSRISNPTVAALEERLAVLEGGIGSICTSSGMAALHLAIVTLLSNGDHIVASSSIYGGSRNLLGLTLPRFGINTTFVEPNDMVSISNAIKPETRLIFAETIGNPGLEVLDIENVSNLAHKNNIPLLVDNTFATPYLCRPIDFGADIVIHSATKFIGGHGVAIGGVLIDSGRFDWKNSGLFPTLTESYSGYSDLNFSEEFGPNAMLSRARAEGLRDFGACMSPQNAFYLMLGVETLGPRMKSHVKNAEKIAMYLNTKEEVRWVSYPGLKDDKEYKLSQKYMPNGAGAIIVFGLGGDRNRGSKFIENLNLFSHLANVGDAKSLVIHPASTTHAQLNPEELAKIGISEDMIRLSIGIEDTDDLIDDIEKAIGKSNK